MSVELQFLFNETKDPMPNLFQHEHAFVHKARYIKKDWFSRVGVEELEWPAQNDHLDQ